MIQDGVQVLEITQEHRLAMASLKLAVYAVDAMRVLRRIEQQTDASQEFEHAVRSACPDWRNPGSLEEPEDLLVSVLTHAMTTFQSIFNETDGATQIVLANP